MLRMNTVQHMKHMELMETTELIGHVEYVGYIQKSWNIQNLYIIIFYMLCYITVDT